MSCFIDAHCHLDLEAFAADRTDVLQRAREAGVGGFVVPATTRERWPEVLAMGRHADIAVCLGLHPCFMEAHGPGDIEALGEWLADHREVVAVGECGLDARFAHILDAQQTLLDAQLRLAKAHGLPLVLHCVRANDQLAKRLRQLAPPAGGLVHGFAGSVEQAMVFHRLGFLLGLGGAVTYPRARRLQRAVAALPDDGYVLETDSPDMPLSGYQGQRNEPRRVVEVCRAVAELKGQTPEQVAMNSTRNARRLFALA
ncbi:TatD family hydrolase [Halomonas sp. 18H]|nr:TatD family hydrolase [Halomonas sp. 18H]MCW4151823.1 TatD family hydrolase [Halomonas sp. 18H]